MCYLFEGTLRFHCIGYDYMVYMDYMDLTVCYPIKTLNVNSFIHSRLWWNFQKSFVSIILNADNGLYLSSLSTNMWNQNDMEVLPWKFVSKLLLYWFHSVCPSVRPSIRPASHVRFVASTVLVGSISYLHILSSNFRWCVACKVSCKV